MVKPEEPVSKTASEMINKKEEALPVYSEKKFLGVVTAKDIIKSAEDAPKTKVRTLLLQPPTTEDEDEVVSLMANNELPVMVKDELVHRWERLEPSDMELKNILEDVKTVKPEDSVDKARKYLVEKGKRLVAVVDEELRGYLDVFSLLKLVHPKYKMGFRDAAGEKKSESDIPVKELMDRPSTFTEKSSVSSVVKKLKKDKRPQIILSDGKIIGAVTFTSVLRNLQQTQKKGVYVQIVGLDKEESGFRNKVDQDIEKTVKKLGRIKERLRRLTVYVKKHDTGGKRTKYSVRTRLETAKDVVVSKDWSWNFVEALESSLEKLEREVINKWEKAREKARGKTV